MNAEFLSAVFVLVKEVMVEHNEYLTTLDSAAGDGDLGLTMSDGFTAASLAIDQAVESGEQDIGKILYVGGKTMGSAVPSTMGTLMARGMMNAGKKLKGLETLTNSDVVDLFDAYLEGVQQLGKAQVGDKTFIDGLAPAVTAMRNNQENLTVMAEKAYQAAVLGFKNTTTMVAVYGRAAIRGEASREMEDPGAAVAMLIMDAFEKAVKSQ